MVLLAASICNKQGKALLSRQFVEMTRSRIEGLLASFSKLLVKGKEHSFAETDAVRFVYQPLDRIYLVLLTTKNSNILEDLETLKLFCRVVPEYCKTMNEKEVINNAFSLIFAFDEIVALGYRESVTVAQIRTFTEMDSHEERIQDAVRATQVRDAEKAAKEKAKELSLLRKETAKSGKPPPGTGFGYGSPPSLAKSTPLSEVNRSIGSYKSADIASTKLKPAKGMQLGARNKDVDTFLNQLNLEGEKLYSEDKKGSISSTPILSVVTEKVHVHTEEKITCVVGRNGGVENLEITGAMSFRISDQIPATVVLKVETSDDDVQLQLHPKFDKEKYKTTGLLALKNPREPLPVSTDISALKWRLQTEDVSSVPVAINCWPSPYGNGCEVNIEYTLNKLELELQDVTISIQIPQGTGSPVVSACDGEYRYERSALHWQIPVINKTTFSGAMEFKTPGGTPNSFFPVVLNFSSQASILGVKVTEISIPGAEESLKFSGDHSTSVDKYEIV